MNQFIKKTVALLLLTTVLVAADFTNANNKVNAQVKVSVEGPWDLIHDLLCPPGKKVCKQGVCADAACISFRKDCSGGGQSVCDGEKPSTADHSVSI